MKKENGNTANGKKRILIVDDDVNLLQIIGRTLELEGYDVITTGDGNKAIELIPEFKPHLVILDIMMPIISGYDVLLRIRRQYDIPVLMLTAIGAVEALEKSIEAGADGYVTKPFQTGELVARIRALLRRARVTN